MTVSDAGRVSDGAFAVPDEGFVLLTGPPGSGKTAALVARALRLARDGEPVLLTSPSTLARLAARVAEAGSPPSQATVVVQPLEALAAEILRADGQDPAIIPDYRAARVFEEIGADLFRLDWTEFVTPEIDPEITGLRAPQRFAAAAFRLIRRLRAAGITPADFRGAWMRGATEFYAKPPNFGDPELKAATKPEYRDSLAVAPSELERQRRGELDLARILSRLYESYDASLVRAGCLTARDAVLEAGRRLAARPELAAATRARLPFACIDDAQDLTTTDLALLRAIYGERLTRVALAGDPEQRTRTFSGALGDAALRGAAETIVLDASTPARARLGDVARRGLGAAARPRLPVAASPESPRPSAEAAPDAARTVVAAFARGRDVADEARIVADFVREALSNGTPPHEIAVVTRSLRAATPYLDALLARDVDCDLAGDGSLFDYAPALDLLAALWATADPFRHDFLLRALAAPWMRLSDATIARLCAEPSQTQTALFALPDEPAETRGRWDRRRDFRLARSVTRGDADLDLGAEARARLERFRVMLDRWRAAEAALDLPALVRLVADESVLASLPAGAHGRFAEDVVRRLVAHVDAFAASDPLAGLHDLLEEIQALRDREESLLTIAPLRANAVRVLDVDAAKGQDFAFVAVPDVRAGAFPRYYVPDAFVFTPKLGVVPKDASGDALTARTAKFTYTMFKTKAQQRFLEEERRAFYVAASRARERLLVTASGRATKGVGAPEILEELRAAGLSGTADANDGRGGRD